MDTTLIRRLRFTARHHYRVDGLPDEENRRLFGDQALPHSHDWVVEVQVAGPGDPQTGWVVHLGVLDGVLAELTEGWDGGDLNQRIPEVREGSMQPSTESLARWLHGRVADALPPPLRVERVVVFESDLLGAAYPS